MSFSDELNFRELGGLMTNDGRKVKEGIFYRGCGLAFFDEKELDEFKKLGIKTIMDLRSSFEIESTPDPKIEGTTFIEHSGMKVEGSEDIDWSPAGMRKIGGDALEQLEKIKGYYRKVAINNTAYKLMMDRIVNDEVPIYFHCFAGKDRTGIAAVIILLALDVKMEEIRKNYLLSNVYRKKLLDRGLKSAENLIEDHPETVKLITIQEGVLEDNLDTVLDSIIDKYGSFSEYLYQEYGLDETKLKQLRNKYTVAV